MPAGRAGELALVVRGGVVESRHVGHAVLVDPDGEVVASVGDPATSLLPRSALKPWQAATVRRLGAHVLGDTLDGEALAITAGSHAATRRHVDLVGRMLAAAGVGPGALGCPATLPGDEDARAEVLRSGGGPTRLAHNCSGKHAGMLLACVAQGWPLHGYLAPDHPLQAAVREDLEAAVHGPVVATVVDGCGAPQHAVPLVALARAAGRLARGGAHERAVVAAMRAHPWAVAGPGRFDMRVMGRVDGLVAKGGAEGVQLLATKAGWSVVVKAADGAARASTTAALALLDRVPDLDLADVRAEVREVVEGGGVEVGEVRPGADVLEHGGGRR